MSLVLGNYFAKLVGVKRRNGWNILAAAVLGMIFLPMLASAARYTPKQLDAFATRVGKTFWAVPLDNRLPTFYARPAANAPAFQPKANEAFDITELVGRATDNPFYKVHFESGKDGYIRPEAFHEHLNATIVTQDPLANERLKGEQAEAEESQRVEWIKSQPWSAAMKEAALKRQPIAGLNTFEVRKIMGEPVRVTRTRSATNTGAAKPNRNQVSNSNQREEQWLYADGSILVFNGGLLSRIDAAPPAQK
ncbi:MAG: hypothetical protein FJ145_09770 [Deltaproteobacteria bacterium]|nr:hypothetical protein [Deltaproteobacteria bacterium]